MELIKYKLLHRKENHKQNEQTTYGIYLEKIFANDMTNKLNFQNIQTTHTAQQQSQSQ